MMSYMKLEEVGEGSNKALIARKPSGENSGALGVWVSSIVCLSILSIEPSKGAWAKPGELGKH